MQMLLRLIVLLTAWLGLAQAAAQPRPDALTRPWLEAYLTELSHDSLEGRATFTPGIERAARLIEREFTRAGLRPITGLRDTVRGFRQTYILFRPARGRVVGQLNGQTLGAAQAFAVGPAELTELSSRSAGRITVARARRGEPLMSRWRSLLSGGEPAVLLVDTSLRREFAALHQARPQWLPPALPLHPVVVILTAERELRELEVTVRAGLDTLMAHNVIGVLPGRSRPHEWVLFTAHYDHLGIIAPVGGDSIANGADDDGTGTTAVVALAHHLAAEAAAGRGPERTVVFACFSGEELGLLGSTHFARTIAQPDSVIAGFNLEMLGKASHRGPATAWIAGWDKSNFGPLLNAALRATEALGTRSDSTFFADPYPAQNLWRRSDHYSLAQRGIPAHMIMSDAFDRDRLYHTVDDEIGSLDLDHFTAIVRRIAAAARTILQGAVAPTRIRE